MKKRFLRNLCVSVIVLVPLLLSSLAFAQLTSGDLTGVVSDASGAAVPNATVSALNTATGAKATQTANAVGEYHFTNLPVGTYNLTASAPGFGSTELAQVVVDLNKIATANIALQVGTTVSTVEVTEAAIAIDTSTAQISSSYDTKLTADLPTSSTGSGVLNLSLLAGGVASSGGVGAGSGPSVAGQRPRNNNFTVEGIDNNSKSVTGPLIFIPNDSVQEFTLLQNQFTAEYGHSSGGQFNTAVKSGSNSFHGGVYDYLQNRNLDAIDQVFQNQGITKNPRYDQNRLGGEVGGPILKNKLFFYELFEYNPLGQSSTTGDVSAPTAAGYATLATLPGLSQTNFNVLKQYVPPATTANSTETFQIGQSGIGCSPQIAAACYTIPVGFLPIAGPNFTNGYYNVSSVDYNLSDKDQLRGRYIYNKTSGVDTAAELPAFYLSLPTTYYLGTLTEYHNFAPSVTNEFRLGYNRYNNSTPAGNFKFPGLDSFPNLQPDDNLGLQLGPDGNAPQFTIQNLYQLTDNVSWTKGRHQFKFGFDGRKYISPQSFTQRSRGDYEYSNIGLYLLDYLPDDLAERTTGNYVYYGDQTALYGYVNDDFKATKHLSFNVGLRYEFTSVPYGERLQAVNSASSVPGLISFNKPSPQYTNFAPRVGLAYSPGNDGNTSIRAGFGINYDVLFDNLGILSAPPQFQQTIDATSPATGFLANGGISPNSSSTLSVADARAATSGYIPNQKLPYSIQWNAGIQHVFAKNYTAEVRYVGTRGVHLDVQDRLNRQTVITPTNSLPTYLSAPSQATLDALPLTLTQLESEPSFVPAYTAAGFQNNIVGFLPRGNSTYHGLSTQLDRRFAAGLTFRGAYTWSHAIDDTTADVFSTVLSPRRVQDFQNISDDKASSALDHRQRFTLATVYDVPFYKGSNNWAMKNLVGNWEVAPIYTYQSPEYLTVQSGIDANLNGDSAPDRSIINPAGQAGTSSATTALTNSSGAVVAYLAVNPNAEYIQARAGAYANGGRNTLAGRPIDNLDFSLVKRFAITERIRFEFQTQFLNGLNHPQFVTGSLNDIRSVGYTSSAVRNILITGNSAFNDPESALSSNPRTIQLTGKLTF
jgi:hypothetical protein